MKPRVISAVCLLLMLWQLSATVAQELPLLPHARVVIVVDNSVFASLKMRLARYIKNVLQTHAVVCIVRPADYYQMKPAEIRAFLKQEYESRRIPLVGAIMVGPIPHALRTTGPRQRLIPCPLYYEDFDAEWVDQDNDGNFEDVITDRRQNITEIWTAWWVPPALDQLTQLRLLRSWIGKLDRYYGGELVGRDQMLWLGGEDVGDDVCQRWAKMLRPGLEPLEQELKIWSRAGQQPGVHHPAEAGGDFIAQELLDALTSQSWLHAHIVAPGDAEGWKWGETGLVTVRPDQDASERVVLLDATAFQRRGPNIVTTVGGGLANFRGDGVKPAYDKSVANQLLFSKYTNTVAFCGAAAPRTAAEDPDYCEKILAALTSDGDSYLAEGYYRMRNGDYARGDERYIFRGLEERVLLGDPFARYPDSVQLAKPKKSAEPQRKPNAP